jgi:hypothetical protein
MHPEHAENSQVPCPLGVVHEAPVERLRRLALYDLGPHPA